MGKIIFTTSWDDGHKLDIKLAGLLDKYGVKGTFYISRDYFSGDRLSDEEILTISKSHEIGAHTVNHPNLTKIPASQAEKEIKESKDWLEAVIGKPIKMFCYPFGDYNEQVVELVKKAGFTGARITKKFKTEEPNPYKMGVTAQVYPFPFRKLNSRKYYWRYLLQPLQQNLDGIKELNIPLTSLRGWNSFIKAVFDAIQRKNGIFHLWGHSWEIEKYGMWEDLEDILQFITDKKEAVYLSNSEALLK